MRPLIVLLVTLAAAAPGSAGTLALYVFDGGDPEPVTSSVAGLIGSDLTRNGVVPDQTGDSFSDVGTDWPTAAYSSTAYYEVTLTPAVDYAIDYSTVTFDYTIGSNPTFTTEILSSVDDFTTPLSSHVSNAGISGYSDSLAALG